MSILRLSGLMCIGNGRDKTDQMTLKQTFGNVINGYVSKKSFLEFWNYKIHDIGNIGRRRIRTPNSEQFCSSLSGRTSSHRPGYTDTIRTADRHRAELSADVWLIPINCSKIYWFVSLLMDNSLTLVCWTKLIPITW